MRLSRWLPALVLVVGLAVPAVADDTSGLAKYQSLLTPLFAGGKTIIGQDIVYPTGTPKITAAVVTFAPGQDSGWHIHAVPLFATILEGELTVDYGSKGVKVYKAGDSMMEAMNWPHRATNKTDKPVRLMAVYIGAEGVANATPVAGPQ